jgi:hypothetical protein
MVDLSVKIGSLTLPNPVLPASGTFSAEYGQVIDLAWALSSPRPCRATIAPAIRRPAFTRSRRG